MKKHEIEKKIETAFNSLDHVCRVGPGPFFFTRVQARVNRIDRTFWEKISGFIAKPAVAFTVICLVISLNTLVIFQSETSSVITEQNSFFASEDSDVDTIAFYDEENNNSESQ
jgi:hypothetical protein